MLGTLFQKVGRWKSLIITLVGLGAIILFPLPASADSVVVTDCSNENQLTIFINTAPASGRTITFSCGTATIIFTFVHPIAQNITIDGGSLITLSTSTNTSHFQVFSGKTLTLQNITLANGKYSVAGSIENFGTTIIDNSTFTNNQSTNKAGAILNHGTLIITNSIFSNNQALNGGGAIYNDVSTASVSVNGSTFINNKTTNATAVGGAIATDAGTLSAQSTTFNNNSAFDGGAIQVNSGATATINASTVISNSASYGGGIESFGAITVTNSTVTLNKSVNDGGGVWNASGTGTLKDTTVSRNTAGIGGGISNYASLVLTNVTINNNSSTNNGGGIYSNGPATLTNVTLTANQVTGLGKLGGGLYLNSASTSWMTYVTFVGNSATAGGGFNNSGVGTLWLQNVLLSANTPDNCAGAYNSVGHNLSSDNYCGNFTQLGDMKNTLAKLGPLANNGGPTQTHMLLIGSPAIDGGQCVGGISTDQRGVARPQRATCDIGALEKTPTDGLLFLPLIVR